MENYERRLDWVHPPSDAEVTSLSETLHDGYLYEAHHDRSKRTVVFEVFVPHLRLKTTITASGVYGAHVFRTVGSADEGFYGSESWEEFEVSLHKPDVRFDTLEASLLRRSPAIAIQIGGLLNGEHYYELSVAGSRLTVEGGVATLEDFIQRGRDYWEAFGARSNSLKTATESAPGPAD